MEDDNNNYPMHDETADSHFTDTSESFSEDIARSEEDTVILASNKPNKKTRVWLGTYATAEMAAQAHDLAALALRGKGGDACLNFADSAWWLPTLPASTNPGKLRRVAAAVVEEFGGMEIDEREVRGIEREVHSGNAE